MSTNVRLATLRTLLDGEPGAERWWALCRALDTCCVGAELEIALEYVEQHLSRCGWPDSLRVAPRSWQRAVLTGAAQPRWRLVRSLALDNLRGIDEQAWGRFWGITLFCTQRKNGSRSKDGPGMRRNTNVDFQAKLRTVQ